MLPPGDAPARRLTSDAAPDPSATRAARTGNAAALTDQQRRCSEPVRRPTALPALHAGKPTVRKIFLFLDTGLLSTLE